jgi:hypothetical protein
VKLYELHQPMAAQLTELLDMTGVRRMMDLVGEVQYAPSPARWWARQMRAGSCLSSCRMVG